MSENPVHEYIERSVTLIVDNDESLLEYVNDAARTAIAEDMGSGDTVAGYLDMLAGHGGHYERWEYARAVGSRIADTLSDYINETIPGDTHPLRLLLADLLDLGNSYLWQEIGEHYLPEADAFDAYTE
jgi:hypothetical protein